MTTVHGVETNEASRFIDHTLATPWETLLNDIESALRSVSKTGESGAKIDIYYYGLTYKLEKRKSTNLKKNENKITTKSERDFSWLQTTYNIGWFVIFSQGHHSTDYHASYRTTMLSAFITAVRNVGGCYGLTIPVFFSYSYVVDISQAADLIGYQILPLQAASAPKSTESTEAVIVRPRWCRYEAHTCPVLYFHPQFEFYDGVRKVLKNQFNALKLAGPTAENFFVETEFSFIHEPNTIYGSMGQRSSAKESSKSGLSGVKGASDTTGVSIFNPSFLKRLTELIPSDEISSTILTDLTVDLEFPAQAQSYVVDNSQHTSYLASKQPPHCWNISVIFRNLPRVGLGELGTPLHTTASRNPYLLAFHSAGSESPLSASWMSLCVRKLLSFYMLSVYCTRAKVNIETMSAEIESTANLLDKSTLERIVEVLSEESKDVFYAVCRQQIDAKLTSPASPSPHSPLPATPKGRLASVVKESGPGSLASPSNVLSPSRAGRTASVVSPVGGAGVSHSAPGLGAVATNLFGGDDGWTARMERHRAVVDILFSGECVFSTDVTRGSHFDTPVSSSVGLWMGMFSLLCATSAVDAHDMANMWSKCMRRVHIASEDGQPLPTFTPATHHETHKSRTHSHSSQEGIVSINTAPICLRTLWDDAIERLHDEDTQRSSSCQSGLLLSWPDQCESIVVQKLQQLQFCIATQNEASVYHFPTATVAVQVTRPAEGNAESDAGAEAMVTTRHIVNQPTLFRRLPLTEDMIAMNKYLARKLNLSNSRSNKEHPTLKVQLQIPSILSDIKAFKAANPDLDLLTFCQWYGIQPVPPSAAVNTTVEVSETPLAPSPAPSLSPFADPAPNGSAEMLKIPLEEISRAWESCEALPVEEQGRALFLVEKESEKAMAFLESVTAVQLASEMLTSGIRLLYGVIAKQFDPWLTESAETGPQATALGAWKRNIRSDLALLKEQVENAVESLRPPPVEASTAAASTSSAASAPVEININALILVDSVAGLIQKLETLSIKLQTLGALFKGNRAHAVDNLIHTLSRKDSCTAENDTDMSALYELTRALHNFKEQTHDWQSRDGRELGEPSKKTFTCKLTGPRTQQLVAGAPLPDPSSLFVPIDATSTSANNSAPLGHVQSAQSIAAPLSAISTLPEIFHMEVTVKQRQLRLAFRVPEDAN